MTKDELTTMSTLSTQTPSKHNHPLKEPELLGEMARNLQDESKISYKKGNECSKNNRNISKGLKSHLEGTPLLVKKE